MAHLLLRSPPPRARSASRWPLLAGWLAGLLVVAGCSTPPRGPAPGADGPPAAGSAPEPRELRELPDAEPKVEPIRRGGPNKPYEVLGQSYTPLTGDDPLAETGLASWYGRKFHGRRTASGETYNMYAMTAAHKTMPLPSYARVRNPANGREIVVRVNDRGPFSSGRVIDLSYAAAVKLGVQNGVAPVEVRRITHDEIRAGLWRPSAAPAPALAAAAPEPAVPLPPPAPVWPAEPIRDAAEPTARAHTRAAAGYWLQLGAFAQGPGAYGFQQRLAQELDWLAPLMTVFAEKGLHRLQAGPYASRDEARDAAERVRAALSLVPVIVERR
ncbi:septal ring lytic transglycosylase RlpA family protein [Ideonella sp.]|uniref:septal ring lytic transglycosylase RlpA family protein n=1 Tax=Ideonella sp. TaxID=1929293 RepID=UPI0035B206AF